MKKPLISIIIPIWNAEQYLLQCLDSLRLQTYKNLEILLIDDGSTDQSLVICQKQQQADPRMMVLHQKNAGASTARNYGLSLAKGEFISFLDADDWIDCDYVERLYDAMLQNKADCAICGYQLEYPQYSQKRVINKQILTQEEAIEQMLFPTRYQGFLWNKIFSKTIISEHHLLFNEQIAYYEDMLFCAQYFSFCKKVICISYTGYHYRQHQNSAIYRSFSTEKFITNRLRSIEYLGSILAYCHTKFSQHLCKSRIQTEYATLLRYLLSQKSKSEVLIFLKRRVRKGIFLVAISPLSIQEKIKYISTAIFPNIFSTIWVNREQVYF